MPEHVEPNTAASSEPANKTAADELEEATASVATGEDAPEDCEGKDSFPASDPPSNY